MASLGGGCVLCKSDSVGGRLSTRLSCNHSLAPWYDMLVHVFHVMKAIVKVIKIKLES